MMKTDQIEIGPMDWDKSLVKTVYREEYRGFLITATLSRMGGLTVIAMNTNDIKDENLYIGENVIAARKWVDQNHNLNKVA